MNRPEERQDPLLLVEGFCLAICHDLRSPLATAAAAVHELGRGLRANDGAEQYVEIARISLSKAGELLGALPDLLATETQPTRSVPLAGVVEAVRDDVRLELSLAEGRLRVVGPLPSVLGDAGRLRIALRNLVQNAIRYRRLEAPPEVVIRAWQRDDTCCLTITDNGTGLDRARNPAPGGLGIGLTLARRAIEACGGTLLLTQRRGPGTVATITLVIARAP